MGTAGLGRNGVEVSAEHVDHWGSGTTGGQAAVNAESSSLPPVPLMPLLGRDPQQLGRFRLLGRLGSGGMGTAFLAQGPEGWVVVKEAHLGSASDAQARARFRREVDAMERSQGPWMARLVEADVDAEVPWMAMEFVPGQTLAQVVAQQGPLSGSQLGDLAVELARGLVHLHANAVLHRDLKPGNVMLSPAGARMIDLGVADVEDATALTSTGGPLGTTGWMSPEQVRGDQVGPASDVHAWALCVLFAATGVAPFGQDNSAATMYGVIERVPSVPGTLSEPLRSLIVQALAKDPGRRPSPLEIVSALQTFVSEPSAAASRTAIADPRPAPPAPPAPRRRTGGPARPVAVSLGVAGLVAAIALATTAFFVTRGSDTAGEQLVAPAPTSPSPESGSSDAAPLSGCQNTQLTIGTLLPESGSLAYIGPPQFAGVDLAVGEISDAGGVLGKPVVNERGDSGDAVTDVASQTVDSHLANGVQAVIGAASSAVTLTVIDKITSNDVVMISPVNTSPVLTDYPDDGLYFRLAPSDALQGAVQASLAIDDGLTRGGTIAARNSYGEGVQAAFVNAFEANGGTVTGRLTYDPDQTDFAAEVAEIAAGSPEFVQLVGFSEVSEIIRELISQGIGPQDVQIYLADGSLSTTEFRDLPRDEMRGVIGTVPALGVAVDVEEFNGRLLKQDPGLTFFDYGAQAYDATILIALAADFAGCADGPAIATALPKIANADAGGEVCRTYADCLGIIEAGGQPNYVGVSGPLDFNTFGDPKAASIDVVRYVTNTKYESIEVVGPVEVPLP